MERDQESDRPFIEVFDVMLPDSLNPSFANLRRRCGCDQEEYELLLAEI